MRRDVVSISEKNNNMTTKIKAKTSVKVYTLGIHYPWLKNIPEAVQEQLFLAHQLRERLVDIYNDYESNITDIWNKFPNITKINKEIYETSVELNAINDEYKELQILQQTKKPTGALAKDVTSRKAAKAKQLRALRKKLKDAKKLHLEQNSDIKEMFKENMAKRIEDEKDTYRQFVQNKGLYHNTHYFVTRNHKTAYAAIVKKRIDGQKATMSHHRFDGTGTLLVNLKPGEKNKRDYLEVSDPKGPHRNTFCVPLPDPEYWDTLKDRQRKQQGRVIARFRIATNDTPDFLQEIPVQLSQAIEADEVIKSAKLVITKVGLQFKGSIQITTHTPSPSKTKNSGKVFFHLGFRREKGNKVRAMTWKADTPFHVWIDVANNPRYPELNKTMTVNDNLKGGTVCIPNYWMQKAVDDQTLRSQRDTLMNELRQTLIEWVETVDPVDHPIYTDPITSAPEKITVLKLKQWKNPMQFVRLAFAWRDNPPNKPNGQEIAEILELWRKNDKKLYNSQVGATRKAALRRNDLYSQVAVLFADQYGEFIIDDTNYAEIAQLAKNDTKLPNKANKAIGRQRSNTAPSILKEKLATKAEAEGIPVTKVSSMYITVQHNSCGTFNKRIDGKMTITCQECGEKYDVDENALENISI